jgi:hypothetical protein
MPECRSQWQRSLRHRSAAARLPGLQVRIQPGPCMSVSHECCVLSGRGMCVGLSTRPEESYRVWLSVLVKTRLRGTVKPRKKLVKPYGITMGKWRRTYSTRQVDQLRNWRCAFYENQRHPLTSLQVLVLTTCKHRHFRAGFDEMDIVDGRMELL